MVVVAAAVEVARISGVRWKGFAEFQSPKLAPWGTPVAGSGCLGGAAGGW